MGAKSTKLSDAEWRVMDVVWCHERVTARRVLDELCRRTAATGDRSGVDWAYTTVKTMLERLAQKGALAADRDGTQTEYEPLVSRRQAQVAAARGLVRKAFDGATSPLVHFLLDEEELSDAERDELLERLRRVGGTTRRQGAASVTWAAGAPSAAAALDWATIVAAWWSWMVAMSWQAGLLIALLLCIDRLVERSGWAQLRYGLWLLAAVKLALPPGLASHWSVGTLLAAGTPSGADVPISPPATAAQAGGLPAIALCLWAAGALAWLTASVLRNRAFRKRTLAGAGPAGAAIERLRDRAARALRIAPPPVLLSPRARTPFVIGLLRPRIVLPADAAARWRRSELEHILLHELAHLRRGDLWLDALFLLLNAAYWFHPLVYVARRRAHTARELSADALAARHLGDAASYRDTLARVAAQTLLGPGAAGAGFFGARSTTCARLRALDRESWRSPGLRRAASLAVVGGLAVALLPMAASPRAEDALEREVAAARAQLATVLEDRPGTGSLHRRYAVMALGAAEHRLQQSQNSTTGGDVE